VPAFTRQVDGETIVANDINELQVALENGNWVAAPTATTSYLSDEFVGNGGVGSLQWQTNGGTTGASSTAVAGHPGILTRGSGATANTLCAHVLSSGFDAADLFDLTFIFQMPTGSAGADVQFRAGAGTNALGANPPGDGVFIEKLAADTEWFFVTRNSSTSTRTTAGVTVTAQQWLNVRMRRIGATSIGFTLNAGTEVVMTTNLPVVGKILQPFFTILGTTTTGRFANIDLFALTITGLTR